MPPADMRAFGATIHTRVVHAAGLHAYRRRRRRRRREEEEGQRCCREASANYVSVVT